MDSNEVLNSLSNLEKSLKEVDSAKKMVEDTVKGYNDFAKKFRVYTESLEKVSAGFSGIVESVKNESSAISKSYAGKMDNVANSLKKSVDEFKAIVTDSGINLTSKTDDAISSFQKSLDSSLSSVEKALDGYSKDYKDSIEGYGKRYKEESDKNLTGLSQYCSEVQSKFQTSVDDSISRISQSTKNLDNAKEETIKFKKSTTRLLWVIIILLLLDFALRLYPVLLNFLK